MMNESQASETQIRIIPALPHWWHWLVIVYGLTLLLWMSVEDDHVLFASLLGVGMSLLLVIHYTWKGFAQRRITVIALPFAGVFIGGMIGGLAIIFTALLMLFKNAWHAHIFPDFPPALIGAMLDRLPFWSLAGALIGFGCALAWLAWNDSHPDQSNKA